MTLPKVVSESRTYVMACRKLGEPGWFFSKFTLPDDILNNTDYASWYFVNKLNLTELVGPCYTFEDFSDLREAQEPLYEKGEKEIYEELTRRLAND